MAYPQKLAEILADFAFVSTRSERADLLIDFADRFQIVPEYIAVPPYPADHRVEFCESGAYVWAVPQPDNTLKFYFAVENPQGLSSRALTVILDEALSGAPVEQVAQVSPDIVFQIFGDEVSMGKGQGLAGIVSAVQAAARAHLARR